MATELSIKSNSFSSLPPPGPMTPPCEDCKRKESCMCDELIVDIPEFEELRKSFCDKCHCEAKMADGLCACCYYEQQEKEDYPPCSECKDEKATMEGMCADCFWEEDSRRKQERRNNPAWVFHRSYSTFATLLNKTEEEAYTLAKEHIQNLFGDKAKEYLNHLREKENEKSKKIESKEL